MRVNPEFIKQIINREDNLFGKIYDFNNRISSYIDSSHIEGDEQVYQICQILKGNKRAEQRLSLYLQEHFNIKHEDYYNFEDPRIRLALLDSQVLEKLLLFAGAALYGKRINKVITKNEVLAMKEQLSDELYFFAAKRSPLLSTIMPKLDIVQEGPIDKNHFIQAGKQCLEMCFNAEDDVLLGRLKLKFPKNYQWNFNREEHKGLNIQAWNYLHRILIKEIQPELKVCFM